MSIDIKIRKGLNLRLRGAASNTLKTAPTSTNYAINPTDFHGVFPKLVCKEGTSVQAGQPLFFSKYQDSIQFVSPVSGTVKEIKRGAKRKVLEIVVAADKKQQLVKHKLPALDKIAPEQVKELLLASGNWPFIKQRPYDIVADPNATPKAIFVSALATAPLSAQYDVILEGQQDAFQTGIDMLSKLSPNLHLSVGAQESSQIAETKNCTIHRVKGPHPAGNVGVQIHHIDPINAGETVWVVGAEDVANIGRFFQTGVFDASRTLAVVGHPLSTPCYFKSKVGASLAPILKEVGAENLANLRVINGDVLTGTATSSAGYVGYYNNTVSVLPEGDRYRMFGWLPFAGP